MTGPLSSSSSEPSTPPRVGPPSAPRHIGPKAKTPTRLPSAIKPAATPPSQNSSPIRGKPQAGQGTNPSKVGSVASPIKPKNVKPTGESPAHGEQCPLGAFVKGREISGEFINELAGFLKSNDHSFSREAVLQVEKMLLNVSHQALQTVSTDDWCLINIWAILNLLPVNPDQAVHLAVRNEVVKRMNVFLVSTFDAKVTEEAHKKLLEDWKQYIENPEIKGVLPIERKAAQMIAQKLTRELYKKPLLKGIAEYREKHPEIQGNRRASECLVQLASIVSGMIDA